MHDFTVMWNRCFAKYTETTLFFEGELYNVSVRQLVRISVFAIYGNIVYTSGIL